MDEWMEGWRDSKIDLSDYLSVLLIVMLMVDVNTGLI